MAVFRGRLALTRMVLARRYDAPPEFLRFFPKDLGLADDLWDDEHNPFFPSPYGLIGRVLRPDEVSPADVFIDLGCGSGHVLLEVARRYPFGRVMGVDFVPELTAVARETVARNRDRLRCPDVDVVTQDVAHYEVPDDVTVAYLFDPVGGETFDLVVANLLASLDRNPRSLRLVYAVPTLAERLERTGRARLVRHGRRMLRRWQRADYLVMYELVPAGTTVDDALTVP